MTIKLELFYSPYCSRCRKAREHLRSIASNWPAGCLEVHELDVVKELDRAVARGVMQTPALVIDGVLVKGSVPSREMLLALLRQRLKEHQTP